jgi:hypothetical protein
MTSCNNSIIICLLDEMIIRMMSSLHAGKKILKRGLLGWDWRYILLIDIQRCMRRILMVEVRRIENLSRERLKCRLGLLLDS